MKLCSNKVVCLFLTNYAEKKRSLYVFQSTVNIELKKKDAGDYQKSREIVCNSL